MGKRDRFGITLNGFHTLQKGKVIVKEIGKKVTIEVTARWITFDSELIGKEGPLEAKIFELSDCRDILGPWDAIEKEYKDQVSATKSKHQFQTQVEIELRRLGIEYTLGMDRLSISNDSLEELLSALKSAP